MTREAGERSRPWSRTTRRGRIRAVAAGFLAVAVVGVGAWRLLDRDATPDAPVTAPTPPAAAAPVAPPPAPRPAPAAPAGIDAWLAAEFGIEDIAASGIRMEDEGLDLITGIFRDGYDFLAEEGEWREWTRNFVPRPTRDIDPGFVEGAVLLLDPEPVCVDFHRQIRDLRSGVPGRAGARIDAAMLEATGPRPFPYVGAEVDGSFPHCLDPDKGEWWGRGYILDEVLPVACALPDRELRCYVFTRWYYGQMARDHWFAEAFVFDATTGERLTGEVLHPGMSAERLARLVTLALAADAAPAHHLAEAELVAALESRSTSGVGPPPHSVIPTVDGVDLYWLDYYRWQSVVELAGRRLHVPWAVVRAG